MEQRVNIRELVVELLIQITDKGEQSHIVIRQLLNKYNYLEEYDKAFLKRVTEGTLERLISIDYVLQSYSTVKVKKMKPFIRSLLRMSVYQILYMDKVPDSAVCNEAVKIASKRGFYQLKGFVNAVLRNIVRNKNRLEKPDRTKNPVLYFSLLYSMPEHLVKLLLKQYGEKTAEKILKAYLAEKPFTIRMRECLPVEKQKEILTALRNRKVEVQRHPYLPYAYAVKGMGNLNEDQYFREGAYTVQDVSSMLVCEVADLKAGNRVLDVCAAPGGKSVHAADKLHGSGMVEARDLTEYKTSLILENKERMQVKNLCVKVWDATVPDEAAKDKYDVVLLDIPCSGMGVIGKKPEIKYRLSEEHLKELDSLQKKIADTVWNYVKPGGTLVYSTCTIRKEENEGMISYLTEHYPFTLSSLNPYLISDLQNEDSSRGYLTLLPGQNSDGFFIARLLRKEA